MQASQSANQSSVVQQAQSAEPDSSSIPFPTFYATASTTHDGKPSYYQHSHTWPPPSSALGLQAFAYTSGSDSTPILPPITAPPPLELSLTFSTSPPPSRPSHIRSPAESFSSTNSVYGYARSTRPSLSPVAEETSSTGSKSPRSAQTSDPSRPSGESASRPKRDSAVHGSSGRRHRWSRLSSSEVGRRSSSSWVLDDGTSNNGRGFVTFEDDLMRAILAIAPPHVKKVPPPKKRRRFRWRWRPSRGSRASSSSRRKPREGRSSQSSGVFCYSFRGVGRRALNMAKSLMPVRAR